jgi:hypothetical protein
MTRAIRTRYSLEEYGKLGEEEIYFPKKCTHFIEYLKMDLQADSQRKR